MNAVVALKPEADLGPCTGNIKVNDNMYYVWSESY